jgi:hypothetical protein
MLSDKYIDMLDYKLFFTLKNETWQQALDRYIMFCEADMKDYFLTKTYAYRFADNKAYTLHTPQAIEPQSIDLFTANWGIEVPRQLTDLLCTYGAMCIGDGLLTLFDDKEQSSPILSLSQVLDKYGYSDFIQQIRPGILKSVSGFYFFFGVIFAQSDEMAFLYFSKAGHFGKMLFSKVNQDLVLNKILPAMFNGSIDKYTLDTLISSLIDRVIINALTVRGYLA